MMVLLSRDRTICRERKSGRRFTPADSGVHNRKQSWSRGSTKNLQDLKGRGACVSIIKSSGGTVARLRLDICVLRLATLECAVGSSGGGSRVPRMKDNVIVTSGKNLISCIPQT